MATVVLGVTGCIAAYKACELARALMREGVRVKVVMTEAATHLVGPATFRALTGEPVAVSLWEDPEKRVHHVSLAEEVDVLAIVPCTANTLGKIVCGRADDLLTTVALATEAAIVLAPAMNVHMWRDDAVQANVAALRARGYVVVEPGTGELACGEVGEGRLAELPELLDAILTEVRRASDLAGVRLLVTAGGTQEPIDPVRFIGNRASGRTGFAIAEEAAKRGAEVTLVTGPTELPTPFGVSGVRVTTALEMRDAVAAAYDATDAVIATAAVADFRPARPFEHKVKKDAAPDTVPLERNPDILGELGERKGNRLLVGFAAETQDVVANAREKLGRKNLDMVVANDVSQPGLGFASARNVVTLVTEDGAEEFEEMEKRAIARALLDRVAAMLAARRR